MSTTHDFPSPLSFTHSIAFLTEGLFIHIVELLSLQLPLTLEASEALDMEQLVQGTDGWLCS